MDKKSLSETDISSKFITPAVTRAGWDETTQIRREVDFTKGRIIVRGKLVTRGKAKRADFILYYKPNIPLALIEAKKNSLSLGDGMQQALGYANTLHIPFPPPPRSHPPRSAPRKVGRQSSGEPREWTFWPEKCGAAGAGCKGALVRPLCAWNVCLHCHPHSVGSREDSRPTFLEPIHGACSFGLQPSTPSVKAHKQVSPVNGAPDKQFIWIVFAPLYPP